jgi:hypothetical protein
MHMLVRRPPTALMALALSVGFSACGQEPSSAGRKAISVVIDTEKEVNPRISKYLFGVNLFLWSENTATPPMEARLKEMGAALIEAPGGNPRGRYWWHNNRLALKKKLPDESGLLSIVRMARRIGAEPMIGLNDKFGIMGESHPDIKGNDIKGNDIFADGPYEAVPDGVAYAADLVRHLNGTDPARHAPPAPKTKTSPGIKYVELSSEPLYWMGSATSWSDEEKLTRYCKWFRDCATAVKRMDPDIKIVGPGLTAPYYYHKIKMKRKSGPVHGALDRFLGECGDLVDVLTVHRYPGAFKTMRDAMAYTEVWDKIIPHLRRKIDAHCVKRWKRDPDEVKIGVSEWSFANKNGSDPDLGSQWETAIWSGDCLCRFIRNNVFLASYWCASGSFHGFFDADDARQADPKPFFHVFKFLRAHVDPTHENGSALLAHSLPDTNVCVYPVRHGNTISVIVINKHQTQGYELTFSSDRTRLSGWMQHHLNRDGTVLSRKAPAGMAVGPMSIACLELKLGERE